MERGNFSIAFHAEKKKPNANKKLNFDTLKCGNCAGYVLVLWSASSTISRRGHHDWRALPRPREIESWPEHWPEDIGRYWLQAHTNLRAENWDAAAMTARTALQLALRRQGAEGRNLKQEIDNLASTGELPPLMKEWSGEVRELGNDATHPAPGQAATSAQDAQDIVSFLDFLLEYLYDLPHRIETYRSRRAESEQDPPNARGAG
jgi:hypothetical protein